MVGCSRRWYILAAAYIPLGQALLASSASWHRRSFAADRRRGTALTMNLAGGGLNPLSTPDMTGDEGVEEFVSVKRHEAFLQKMGTLPLGFSVGISELTFDPVEVPSMVDLPMRLTLIMLDKPTTAWTALYTTNAFPGAPVLVGKKRLAKGGPLQAIIVNNKIANVCAGGAPGAGEKASEDVCRGVGRLLSLMREEEGGAGGDTAEEEDAYAQMVLPCSTGVIGWSLPVPAMLRAVPTVVESARSGSLNALDAARGIMTTDRYPKVRSETLPPMDGNDVGATVVGFAKGAGMIEPHLATMLAYVLTDLDVPKELLQKSLRNAVKRSFNSISVDSDESTSDTVVIVSSRRVPCPDLSPSSPQLRAFEACLVRLCADLADDVVRNGEGTNHVVEVTVKGAPSDEAALGLGRAIVNSPLLKCAVAGNDPNVGRLVAAVGKFVGDHAEEYQAAAAAAEAAEGEEDEAGKAAEAKPGGLLDRCVMKMGGHVMFAKGQFILNGDLERELVAHMKAAELADNGKGEFPAHKRRVEVEVDLAIASGEAVVLGSDLTHEYVTINADYRS